MNRCSAFLLVLFFSFLMHMNCSTLQLESTWKDRDITLDGKGGDWLGSKYYFEDVAISIGLINDAQYLYVSMMTENPMIRAQIMRKGLTVWLDPKGGKNKTFGIKYPLGRQRTEQEALISSEEHPFAVGVKPGDMIGVGFLSPKLQMQRPRGMRSGGMPGMGGRGGMGGGVGGMRATGMGRQMPQQLKIWAKVKLAADFPLPMQ